MQMMTFNLRVAVFVNLAQTAAFDFAKQERGHHIHTYSILLDGNIA